MSTLYSGTIAEKSDAELVEICNLDRQNSDMIEWVNAAYNELVARGKTPVIIRREADGKPIYGLEGGN